MNGWYRRIHSAMKGTLPYARHSIPAWEYQETSNWINESTILLSIYLFSSNVIVSCQAHFSCRRIQCLVAFRFATYLPSNLSHSRRINRTVISIIWPELVFIVSVRRDQPFHAGNRPHREPTWHLFCLIHSVHELFLKYPCNGTTFIAFTADINVE